MRRADVPPAAGLELSHDDGSVRRAREFVMATLDGWGASVDREDARLLTSELVTNAVMYTDEGICVQVRCLPDHVRIEVVDHSSEVPTMGSLDDPTAVSGRGLALVRALSAHWGVHEIENNGKVVWFTLPMGRTRG